MLYRHTAWTCREAGTLLDCTAASLAMFVQPDCQEGSADQTVQQAEVEDKMYFLSQSAGVLKCLLW